MTQPRLFPPLKESDVRRLGSASAFQKGTLLWDDDHVRSPMASTQDAAIFASVYDGPHRQCQVMVRHLAGDEFSAKCDCAQESICSHVVATLLAWVHQAYAFTKVEAAGAQLTPVGPREQWYEYLETSNIQHLRAIARRHQLKLKGTDRAGVLAQVIDRLTEREAAQRAVQHLDEAQRRVLQMVFVLSDSQPDTLASDIQHALGWPTIAEVEEALRELSEWGLVVGITSQWHRSTAYTLAPNVASLMPDVSDAIEAASDQPFDRPRNRFVEPYTGEVTTTLSTARSHHSILEILLLARHLPLQLRPPPPELAQARTIRALRHWPYLIDELVKLQVKPGWLHQGDSVLMVPAPEPRFDDESLAQMHELTGDDALSEFVSHLSLLAKSMRLEPEPHSQLLNGTAEASLREIFTHWQQLVSWTELWNAQQAGALTVRRAVMGAHLSYFDWLAQLAGGRRFITRVLALLKSDYWYDFESLLKFVHTIHADFLHKRSFFPGIQPGWWLEVRAKKVDPQKYEQWRASYGLFIEQILRGPLLWLGVVELALTAPASDIASQPPAALSLRAAKPSDPTPITSLQALRLTAVGEALLHGQALPILTGADTPLRLSDDLKAQLPLGRRDIGAYPLLERLACFECISDGLAHYRFDVGQAHAAFESGLTAVDVLTQLAQLANSPVPAAVSAQWVDWWSRYAQVRWYDGLTLIEFADDYVLQELLTQTDLGEHLIFTFGPRLVAVRPESADAVARQLVKKGYTPKIE